MQKNKTGDRKKKEREREREREGGGHQMISLRLRSGGRHQISPASLPGRRNKKLGLGSVSKITSLSKNQILACNKNIGLDSESTCASLGIRYSHATRT